MRNRLRNLIQDQNGGVAVEMGLTAVPFVLFIIAIIEISLLFFAWNSLQSGAAELAIYAQKTGDPAVISTDWKSIGAVPFNTKFDISANCYQDAVSFQNGFTSVCDASSKIIRWSISMNWKVITPMMAWVLPSTYDLTAVSVTRRP